MSENLRELLGIASADYWHYASFGLLMAGCFFSSVLVVAVLFGFSTALVGVYLVKSFARYLGDNGELSLVVKLYGVVMNVVIIVLHVAVVGMKVAWMLPAG